MKIEDFLEQTFESTKRFMKIHISMLMHLKEKVINEGKNEKAEGIQEAIDLLEDSIEVGRGVMEKVSAEEMERLSLWMGKKDVN